MSPEDLIKKAQAAQKQAISPFSNYPVGAALLANDGTVIFGCNIESKAYPTTLCAERVAIFSALSCGHRNFLALALVTRDGATPCGSCRQILYEYTKNISIFTSDENGNYNTFSIDELLPNPFG